MSRILCVLTLLVFPVSAQSLKTAIEVSDGYQLKYHFLAVGKQIYRCENGAWSKASTPDATLFDENAQPRVRHSAGPTWTTLDGASSIKGIGKTAIHFAAADGISIDWLKLDVDPATRTGMFRDVAAIQRLYTGGGAAPATACTAGQTYESPYTAHYYFWAPK